MGREIEEQNTVAEADVKPSEDPAAISEEEKQVDGKKAEKSRKKRGKHKARGSQKSTKAEAKEDASGENPVDVEGLQNRLLRLQADFDNYRKRTLREKEELWSRAHADVIEEFLPVLDHMDLALEAADKHGAPQAFVEGFQLVRGQMGSTLKKFDLVPQDVVGLEFDPNLHEAVAHMPSDDVPANSIVAQARRGYLLGDRLLRAAQVVVSSGAAESTQPETPGENADS
ncbi:MAG: nucleotide exchange factor GrpE [Kiritimatiellae bacterium]|nr:nucleotide exchange factor GrpE [Kiritimatiellia bacterium]